MTRNEPPDWGPYWEDWDDWESQNKQEPQTGKPTLPADADRPNVKANENGAPVSTCCGAELNVTGIDRNLMRYSVLRLSEQGHLVVDPDGKFLEGQDWESVEAWCGQCGRILDVEVDADD